VLRQIPGQTQEPLAVLFGGQAFDVEQAEDVDDEAGHVAVERHHFEDSDGDKVAFDGPPDASPEKFVNEALQVLVRFASEVEETRFGDGWEAVPDTPDAATENGFCYCLR